MRLEAARLKNTDSLNEGDQATISRPDSKPLAGDLKPRIPNSTSPIWWLILGKNSSYQTGYRLQMRFQCPELKQEVFPL